MVFVFCALVFTMQPAQPLRSDRVSAEFFFGGRRVFRTRGRNWHSLLAVSRCHVSRGTDRRRHSGKPSCGPGPGRRGCPAITVQVPSESGRPALGQPRRQRQAADPPGPAGQPGLAAGGTTGPGPVQKVLTRSSRPGSGYRQHGPGTVAGSRDHDG